MNNSKQQVYLTNIRRGERERAIYIYAEIRDCITSELLVAADLGYCIELIATRYCPPEAA